MPKLRGRLINFRVTDDEFQQLKLACDRHGATCLSAFARKIMLNAPDSGKEELAGQLAVLERRLAALELSVEVSLSRIYSVLTADIPPSRIPAHEAQSDPRP